MIGYKYNAKIIRVLDGDTVEAELDLGFRLIKRDIFRLAGINAPERDVNSTQFLKSKVLNQTIIIESQKSDKYGRWLATVWIPVDGGLQSINQMLIDSGMAVEYNGGKR